MLCYYMGKSNTIRDALKNSSDPHVQGMDWVCLKRGKTLSPFKRSPNSYHNLVEQNTGPYCISCYFRFIRWFWESKACDLMSCGSIIAVACLLADFSSELNQFTCTKQINNECASVKMIYVRLDYLNSHFPLHELKASKESCKPPEQVRRLARVLRTSGQVSKHLTAWQ